MKKLARISFLVLSFSALFCFVSCCNFVCAATINVPGDYATIQTAVDAASDGKSGNAWLVKGKTTLMDKVDVQGYFARREDNQDWQAKGWFCRVIGKY